MARRKTQFLIAITAWQTASLFLFHFYTRFISPLVLTTYTRVFGDVQKSVGTFSRINSYLSMLFVTAFATIIALFVFNRLARLTIGFNRNIVTYCGWLAVVLVMLIWSFEMEFSYRINKFGWAVFGPPENPYGFQNMVLPRIIAWLVVTVPVAFMALGRHRKFGNPISTADFQDTVVGERVERR
ncbi:MAG: hypothetical protein O2955_03500 [Planctomycetota bacterium]|nr:hypothetical protein [Planctomycetota bacterium]MDA1211554.1 hypothetical protein [Planctomycetota bacterium]